MDVLVALAISIGVLIAGWTYVASPDVAGLPVWAGIVAWGCFFAAGGKTTGLSKTIASNLSGVVWAFLLLQALPRFGGSTAALSLTGRAGCLFHGTSGQGFDPVLHSGRLPGRCYGRQRSLTHRSRRLRESVDQDCHRAGDRSVARVPLRDACGRDRREEAGDCLISV